MVNYERDYEWGAESEKEAKKLLEETFGMLTSGDRYSKFDFWNNKYNIELKTRKVYKDFYPTTMIQSNKFLYAIDRDLILAFKFTDGIYYIKYEKALFDTFETRLFSRAKLDWDKKPHTYIPVKYLTKLQEHAADSYAEC